MTEPDPRMSEDLKQLLRSQEYPDGMYMFYPEMFQVRNGKVTQYANKEEKRLQEEAELDGLYYASLNE